MEGAILEVSLEIMDAVPAVVALGMTSACLVVLTVGALVSGFRALIKLIGR